MVNLYTIGWYIILILWLVYLPQGIALVNSYLKNRKKFVFEGSSPTPDVRIVFEIASLSATQELSVVQQTIECARQASRDANLTNYKILLVTDDREDLKLRLGEKVKVVVVPESYETNAIFKARGLQYAVEHVFNRWNLKRTWIFHLDEESLVSPQTLYGVFDFINRGQGVMAEGPIVYSSDLESVSGITRMTESIRSSGCYHCIKEMTGKTPPLHLHGSNLLVRADVEREVGWNAGKTIAEDQLFGLKVFEKYPDGLGWHGGLMVEKPPLTLGAHHKQRVRWMQGTLQNWKYMSASIKRKLAYKLTLWTVGFFASIVSVPLWILSIVYFFEQTLGQKGIPGIPHGVLDTPFLTGAEIVVDIFSGDIGRYLTFTKVVPLVIGVVTLVCLLTWVFSYALGFSLNRRWVRDYSVKDIFKDSFFLVIAILFIGVIENFPAVKGLVDYKWNGRADWQVTRKSFSSSSVQVPTMGTGSISSIRASRLRVA